MTHRRWPFKATEPGEKDDVYVWMYVELEVRGPEYVTISMLDGKAPTPIQELVYFTSLQYFDPSVLWYSRCDGKRVKVEGVVARPQEKGAKERGMLLLNASHEEVRKKIDDELGGMQAMGGKWPLIEAL